MENYIVINGKKLELTEEQLKQLGIEKPRLFKRVLKGEPYLYISCNGDVCESADYGRNIDEKVFNAANYCTDRKLIEQRALHETLNRILWRLACENGELENEWDDKNFHYEIFFDEDAKEFKAQYRVATHTFGPFFPTKEIANKAIGLIYQFMAEHPDFVW